MVSPLTLHASCISQGRIVTHFMCIMHKFVSSISLKINASDASCSTSTFPAWIKSNACFPVQDLPNKLEEWYLLGLITLLFSGTCEFLVQPASPARNLLPFLFFTMAYPCEEGMRGMPISAHFLTVAFVRAIFYDENYENKFSCFFQMSHILSSLVCSLLLSILLFRFKPSLSPQMVCCEIVSLVIDIATFKIFKLQYCRFQKLHNIIPSLHKHKAPYIKIPQTQ